MSAILASLLALALQANGLQQIVIRFPAENFAKRLAAVIEAVQDSYVVPLDRGDIVNWSVRGLYSRLGATPPAEIDVRLRRARVLTPKELHALLADVRLDVAGPDFSNDRCLELAWSGLVPHLDEFCSYRPTVHRIYYDVRELWHGIGVELGPDLENKTVRVITPILDSPAYLAGIRAGDVIARITYFTSQSGMPLTEPKVFVTKGMKVAEVSKRLLGRTDTVISLAIERAGKTLEVPVVRKPIREETVLGARRNKDDHWDHWLDPDKKIAFIRLTRFREETAEDLTKAVAALHKAGIKGLVLDLRFSPGGLVTAGVKVSDLFIDDGLIFTLRTLHGKGVPFEGTHEGSYLDFPMVCLVNGNTERVAEAVAACLQDHQRAVIMGERSRGWGSVENNLDVEEGEISLPSCLFYRPNGKRLHRIRIPDGDDNEWGVTPDKGHALRLLPGERDALEYHLQQLAAIPPRGEGVAVARQVFEDRQLALAMEYLRGQLRVGEGSSRQARPARHQCADNI